MTTTDVADMVRSIIDGNVYMVLGTADEAGRPWVSPVFYASHTCREFFWISSPEVTHSRNLAERPQVSIVIFDSRAPVGSGGSTAVYMAGAAAVVREEDVERSLAVSTDFAGRGGREITAADVRSPAPYRLYRATVTEHSVLCPRPAGSALRRSRARLRPPNPSRSPVERHGEAVGQSADLTTRTTLPVFCSVST